MAFLLPLCWVIWVNEHRVIAGAVTVALVGASAWFFVSQHRERLFVCENGLELDRNGVVWSAPWSEIEGVFAIIHENDLAKVKLRTSTGLRVSFDLNWRDRTALEMLVYELLETYPALPQPVHSPFGLGLRLGQMFRRNRVG
ncbi:MAG TPA: hypothetical protein VF701_08540 [Thermoanaerobaculia bacterium]